MAELTPHDLDALARSWITPELARQAGLIRVSSYEGGTYIGRNGGGNYAGIIFNYCKPGELRAHAVRLRRDNPETENGRVRNKYMAARGDRNRLYFVPGTPVEALADVGTSVVITEGEKKALALFRFSNEYGIGGAEKAGDGSTSTGGTTPFLAVGLPGVWSWRGVIGKEAGADGKRRDVKGPIPDLSWITWAAGSTGRRVYILFDANVTQEDVAAARLSLAKELKARGASVWLIDLPGSDGVNGIDDYLGKHGPDAARALFRTAREFVPKAGLAQFTLTDHGNEQAFTSLYGDHFLYCSTRGRWLFWNEVCFELDEAGVRPDRAMVEVAQQRMISAGTIADEEVRKKHMKAALDLLNMGKRESALRSAFHNPIFARTVNHFDNNDFLLGTLNGVIDLQSGEFRHGLRSDMVTMQCPVDYDPDAECNLWLNFLDDIFPQHPDVIPFIQRALGYSLTGSTKEECFFLMYGEGRNGKGTLINTIEAMMGPYAITADFSTFTASREERPGIPNDIAMMKGARLVSTSEATQGTRLAEGTIKKLTGGDRLTARFLGKEFFSFKPTHKIWMAVNHLPVITDMTTGMWSKIRRIPFDEKFEGREDRDLKRKLLDELPGILAWAVRGCQNWMAGGLQPPDDITEATSDYRKEADQIGQFLAAYTETSIPTATVKAMTLYSVYKKWAEANGERSLSQTSFGCTLRSRGYKKERVESGVVYFGIRLLHSGE